MAATPLNAIFFLGLLGTLAIIGMLRDLGDNATRVVVAFAGAIIWGFFGMSSFDVIVADSSGVIVSQPILPLAYLGIGLAIISGLFGVRLLFTLVGAEATSGDVKEMLQ